MPWIQLKFPAPASEAEALADALHEVGALSVTLQDAGDQPVLEPPPGATQLWDHTTVIGLFEADTDVDGILARLSQRIAPLPEARAEPLEDKDWIRQWMDQFRPMRFGDNLWICPTWQRPPDPAAVNVMLDPGLAFGTGTHPTTALCLQWLDANPPTDRTVIDFGCGSGVLAIAAALLGAERVWAVDHDPQAITATRSNAAANGVSEIIMAGAPNSLPSTPCDMVLANILAAPLIKLAPRFADLVKTGGKIVLSGIIPAQIQPVWDAYADRFQMVSTAEQSDWLRIVGQRC